jgi:hypothetical protein
MNELLLIEMLGDINPELLENDIIEKDLKRGRHSLLKRIFMKNKWNEEDNFPINKPYDDITMEEEVPFSMDIIDSIKHDTNSMKFSNLEYDYKDTQEGLETENTNSLFNISIFKKSFKNLIKIISGIAVALVVLVGIIIFIVKFIVKKHKYSSFIRRKIQVSY